MIDANTKVETAEPYLPEQLKHLRDGMEAGARIQLFAETNANEPLWDANEPTVAQRFWSETDRIIANQSREGAPDETNWQNLNRQLTLFLKLIKQHVPELEAVSKAREPEVSTLAHDVATAARVQLFWEMTGEEQIDANEPAFTQRFWAETDRAIENHQYTDRNGNRQELGDWGNLNTKLGLNLKLAERMVPNFTKALPPNRA